ncbi:hypothetical protein CN934_32515 [Ensifer sp. MMN_5]|nr:hypothetical protein CN934_32515 [Ensifer sp. MMN_5]
MGVGEGRIARCRGALQRRCMRPPVGGVRMICPLGASLRGENEAPTQPRVTVPQPMAGQPRKLTWAAAPWTHLANDLPLEIEDCQLAQVAERYLEVRERLNTPTMTMRKDWMPAQ